MAPIIQVTILQCCYVIKLPPFPIQSTTTLQVVRNNQNCITTHKYGHYFDTGPTSRINAWRRSCRPFTTCCLLRWRMVSSLPCTCMCLPMPPEIPGPTSPVTVPLLPRRVSAGSPAENRRDWRPMGSDPATRFVQRDAVFPRHPIRGCLSESFYPSLSTRVCNGNGIDGRRWQ
jgi:hypothetical protein